MDKVILYGTYEFINFALCKRFLDEGFEVVGIHLATDHANSIIEEKRLEIGRNANFSEELMEMLSINKILSPNSMLILSVYDYYVSENDHQLLDVFQLIYHLMQTGQQFTYPLNITVFMPITLLVYKEKRFIKKINRAFTNFHHYCNKQNWTLTRFYLPTVYGPWQPKDFLFHQAIKNSFVGAEKAQQLSISDREYTKDAIYIDDVVEKILEIIQTDESKSLLLKSELNNHWDICAKAVLDQSVSFNQFIRHEVIEEEIDEKIVVKTTSISEGIEKQKAHLTRMLQGFIK